MLFIRCGLFLIVINIFSANCLGQKSPDYRPYSNNPSIDLNILESIDARLKTDIDQLKGPNRKYAAELYAERVKMIKEEFKDQLFITNTEAQHYLNTLVSEIAKANPDFAIKDLRIFFSRAWWANASSMGEGTILFNISLFNRLQNESQAAFVLCHEFSHYFLNHSNQNIDRYVNTLYSDEMQKELKKISKQEYGKNAKLEGLAKGLLFRNRKHGREYEKAADSMAIVLMRKTRFDLNEALTCLALLDSVDEAKYKNPLSLEKRFHFPTYPFKKSWLQKEETISFNNEEDDNKSIDSLKTHPDCSQRIESLKPLILSYKQNQSTRFVTSEERFNHFKSNFDFEVIQWCYESKRVGRAFYYTLQMLDANQEHPYLHLMVVKCLNKMYEAQKNHQFNTYVELPRKEKDHEYQQLLQFLQNLRLKDIANLSLKYMEKYAEQLKSQADFEEAFSNSRKNFVNHP